MTAYPPWWFKPGQLVWNGEDRHRIGVVLAVAEPGIIQIRWGVDSDAAWYDMNDFFRVKVRF